MNKKAVVLVSGGLDSTTCLAIAKKQGYELYALTLFYGQRHKVELKAARKVAKVYHVKNHLELEVPLTAIGGSALTDRKIKVPKQRSLKEMGKGVPSTYVPARNTVFLSLALAWAEVLGGGAHLHRRKRPGLQRLSRLPAGIHPGLRAPSQVGDQKRGRREMGPQNSHAPHTVVESPNHQNGLKARSGL